MKNGPYELVIAPPDYPGFKYRGRYVYEHQLVWWQRTGKLVPKGYVVHHKNKQRRDNRFRNLELKPSLTHTREHSQARRVLPVILECPVCEKKFPIVARTYRYRRRQGQTKFRCSRSCQVRAQQRELREKRASSKLAMRRSVKP